MGRVVPKIRLHLARIQFALATLRGEVPHQVFVGVAEDVVAVGAVLCRRRRFPEHLLDRRLRLFPERQP
jgi:hypothetical protein